MRRQRSMFQKKGQDKTSEKDLKETDIRNLPDKEFKVMAIKILTELWRRIDKHSENFNKEVENIRKYQTEMTEIKNTIPELKPTLEVFNSRLGEAEEQNRKPKQWNSPRKSKSYIQ